jgi:predicted unusual protein kinase regulating ubiquinone biosynthesis (AarF/ABC1/UbiB family)
MLCAVSRSTDRFLAFVRARVLRATTAVRQAVMTDVDVTTDTRAADLAEAEAFARSAADLGAAVAKMAQLRAYLEVTGAGADTEARARLGRLWDSMPPKPFSLIRGVIEAELGAPPEALFARFDEHPLAAASLGQVHAAEDASGRKLAVKIQYPGVAEALREDLRSSAVLRRLVGPQLGEAAADEALDVLHEQLERELDYVQEAQSLDRFARAFAGDPQIVVPRPLPDRSSARVLTMERIEGQPLSRYIAASVRAELADERARVARTIFKFAWTAPLRHGFFNADPHPGNYLVLDAAAGRVGFVDFGATADLGPGLLKAEQKLWLAMIHREGEELRHAAHLAGLVSAATVFEGEIWRLWERTLAEPFLRKGETTLEPEHAAELMRLTTQLLRSGRIQLPREAVLLWRQRLGAWSVLASLRPRLDFRRELAALLEDGHPVPLLDRYP